MIQSNYFTRRNLIVSIGGVSSLAGAGALAWVSLTPEKAEVRAKELIANGETIVYHNEDRADVNGIFRDLGYDDPDDLLVSEHTDEFWGTYDPDSTAFKLQLDLHDGGIEWFTASMTVFDTVDIGDHIAYQVAITDHTHVRNISCVAPDADSLQTRCDFEGVDVTE